MQGARGHHPRPHVATLFRSHGVPERGSRDVSGGRTRNVLAAPEACDVAPVVHGSSVGLHGDLPDPPADETEPSRPVDSYQVTKCVG